MISSCMLMEMEQPGKPMEMAVKFQNDPRYSPSIRPLMHYNVRDLATSYSRRLRTRFPVPDGFLLRFLMDRVIGALLETNGRQPISLSLSLFPSTYQTMRASRKHLGNNFFVLAYDLS